MNSRSYPIIKPLFKLKSARLKSFLFKFGVISIVFFLGIFLSLKIHIGFVGFIFFAFISPMFVAKLNSRWFYPFKVIGTIECLEKKIFIKIEDKEDVISITELKGVNIRQLIPNPRVKSHSLASKHNAYEVKLKCSLIKQQTLVIFNYVDASVISNDFYSTNFLGELQHYSKNYHIRFWDWKGDPYVDM
jgi:hypothetical protein